MNRVYCEKEFSPLSGESDPPISHAALENDLGGSEELVRLLLNSTGEGIYGIDSQGNCTFANPACLRLLGFKSDAEILGKNMHALVHRTRANGDAYPVEECNIYRALQEREGTVREFIDDFDIAFPIVLDPLRQIVRNYGVQYTNYHVLINKDGNIVGIDELGAERAPVGVENGDVSGGFGGLYSH